MARSGSVARVLLMIGRLDDDFVRADPIHAVEQSLAFAVEIAFDSQRGKFIGDHANGPTWACLARHRCGHRPESPAASCSRCHNKTDKNPCRLMCTLSRKKSLGPLGAIGGNDYPSARDRVPSKFRQRLLLPYGHNSTGLRKPYSELQSNRTGQPERKLCTGLWIRLSATSSRQRRPCAGAPPAAARTATRWPRRRSGPLRVAHAPLRQELPGHARKQRGACRR